MQKLFFSTDNINKKIKNKKINKFDFTKLKKQNMFLCKLITDNVFLRDKICLFNKIHLNFLKLFRNSLSDFMGFNNINITLLDSTLDFYKNHIIKIKQPITLNMIELFVNQEYGIIIFSADLISTIIEYLFGGDNFFICNNIVKKKFTTIELGIIKQITKIMLLSYNKIFQDVFLTSLKYIFSKNIVDCQKNTVFLNNNVFLCTLFKISFNKKHNGIFRIFIPLKTINYLEINSVYSSNKHFTFLKKQSNKILEKAVYNYHVKLNVKLLDNTINFGYVLKLKTGDILPIVNPEKSVIYINNFPIFKGIYNTINKKNAISIKSIINFNKEVTVNKNDISIDKDNTLNNNLIDLSSLSEQKLDTSNIRHENENHILQSDSRSKTLKDISHIINIPVKITIKLGEIKIKIKNLLEVSEGSVLVLDKIIGDPLDIFIDQSLIAKGEMVMVDNQYGIRVTTVIDSLENINSISV